jgi:Spy/CpxP family protein refolding chaperone
MRKHLLSVVVVGLGLAAATGIALAARSEGEGRPGRARDGGPDPVRLQEQLGLSEAQVAELRTLRADQAKQRIRQRADVEIARIELRELLGSPTVDERAVEAAVKRLGALQTAVLEARVGAQLALRKALTAEQWDKLESLRRERPRRGRAPRDGHRPSSRRLGGGDRDEGGPPPEEPR